MKSKLTVQEFSELVKNNSNQQDCAVLQALEILQGKWTAKVLFYLLKKEPLRFGQLKKQIPEITNTMLTSTLRDLEQQGMLSRMQFNEIPPHIEYSLTQKGRAILPVFYELGKWVKESSTDLF